MTGRTTAGTGDALACEGGRPVRDSFLVFGQPDIRQAEIDEVADSMRSGWLGTGPKVARFEAAFREYVGAEHAVAVSSCTAALHLSMLAAGLEPGDEVITTPMTFVATVNAIVHAGARPVFADIDPVSLNIDVDALAAAVSPRTAAVVPVHFAGRPCAMDEVMDLARRRSLVVIEDAAHCIEGVHHGRHIGTIADFTCFSFYVTKNVTTVEGGMVTTADGARAALVKTLAQHGLSADAWGRYSDAGFRHYQAIAPGFKYNMTDVEAAIGLHQLARIDEGAARRRQVWQRYDEAFADLPVVIPAPEEPDTTHARHLYTLQLETDRLGARRDQVLAALHAENIGCGVHYVGVHLHEHYRKLYDLDPEDLPNATKVSERTISLPLSSKLTDADVEDVVTAVVKVLTAYAV